MLLKQVRPCRVPCLSILKNLYWQLKILLESIGLVPIVTFSVELLKSKTITRVIKTVFRGVCHVIVLPPRSLECSHVMVRRPTPDSGDPSICLPSLVPRTTGCRKNCMTQIRLCMFIQFFDNFRFDIKGTNILGLHFLYHLRSAHVRRGQTFDI